MRQPARNWIVIATLGVASAVGVAACANKTADEPPAEQTRAEQRKGPALVVIDAALAQGELSAEQHAAITAIRQRVEAERGDKTELKRELRGAASDIVRSGTADSEQFDEAVDLAMDALEGRIAITGEALAEVHGMLEPGQRGAVAAALREHIAARFARYELRAKRREGFKRFATHLALTGVQIEKLREVRKELLTDKDGLRPTREQLDGLVDAFEGEDFVSAMDAFHEGKLAILRAHVEKMGVRADTVLALLQDEQREILAELIELGPEAVGLRKARAAE